MPQEHSSRPGLSALAVCVESTAEQTKAVKQSQELLICTLDDILDGTASPLIVGLAAQRK